MPARGKEKTFYRMMCFFLRSRIVVLERQNSQAINDRTKARKLTPSLGQRGTDGVHKETKMNSSKRLIVMFSLALLFAGAFSGVARADEWNHATKLTFNQPVEVPGQVLPAGTYWFTLADSLSNRHIVQIWNGDRTQLLNTILAIPDYRMQPEDKTMVHFAERPSDSPQAIRSWFYPGALYGETFVYPRTKTVQLAQNNPPAVEPGSTAAPQVRPAPTMVVKMRTQKVVVAKVVPVEEVASLPQTGSLLPLFGVLGLLSLAAGCGLRFATQKAS
jgi:hypothetical protein